MRKTTTIEEENCRRKGIRPEERRDGKRETGLDMENESVFESEESVNKFKIHEN